METFSSYSIHIRECTSMLKKKAIISADLMVGYALQPSLVKRLGQSWTVSFFLYKKTLYYYNSEGVLESKFNDGWHLWNSEKMCNKLIAICIFADKSRLSGSIQRRTLKVGLKKCQCKKGTCGKMIWNIGTPPFRDIPNLYYIVHFEETIFWVSHDKWDQFWSPLFISVLVIKKNYAQDMNGLVSVLPWSWQCHKTICLFS